PGAAVGAGDVAADARAAYPAAARHRTNAGPAASLADPRHEFHLRHERLTMDFLGIGPIAALASKILDMFPNASQRADALNKLQDFAAAVASKQSDINIAEAASGNWFASSWRPACGW